MTKEECVKKASKFSSRTEFSLGDRPAYDYAKANNIMDELFPDKRQKPKYSTEEERHQAILETNKRYYYRNIDYYRKKGKRWRNTKIGRATQLAAAYSQTDNDTFTSPLTIDKNWIMEKIFSGQKCFYCGDSNWKHLGCDRIDNSLPHTPDNCICACGICNIERGDRYTIEEFVEYRKNNPLPKWDDSDFE